LTTLAKTDKLKLYGKQRSIPVKFWKSMIPIAICLLLVLLLVPAEVGATTVDSGTCGDNLTWTLDDAGTLTISGTGPMDNYDLFDDINAPWYGDKRAVKKVIIEDGVTTIGNCAFGWCTNMTEVTIGGTVTTIGEWAFSHCSALTEAVIPDSVITIGGCAFYDCIEMKTAIVGNSVTTIGDMAFHYCSGLDEITIGKSVATIGLEAFSYCDSLKAVYISDLAAWCEIAFDTGGNPLYRAKKACLYINGVQIKDLVIPEGVTKISDDAFINCAGLTSVTIPDSVTEIGALAFYACADLTQVVMGKGVSSIDRRAFHECTGLKNVYYCATEEDWNDIKIHYDNKPLLEANIHFAVANDLNDDGLFDTDDAVYLLLHVMFGAADYPLAA